MSDVTIFRFAEAMAQELSNNRDKGGWQGCSLKWLINRARQELSELENVVKNHYPPDRVLSEAADVANFCMMVADNYATEDEERRYEAELAREGKETTDGKS
jgi:hypothetical protein